MKKIELLLPAGNWDNLRAAVENGADAVYLGVGQFNARRRANNFRLEEIGEVVDYCHRQDVRVYITLNILVKNSELKTFWETVNQVYAAGADAVIVQHLSFVSIIKQNFPDLEVHLSTQAAVSNSYFAELIEGADKVVLPREFSEQEVKKFIEKVKVPVEVFVQGALCFCYSGKCLFSGFLGGRSGNRGLCAQPCRKKYNGEYLLSMKDLCLVEELPRMIKLGISSLKIEGRLRSANYVAAATRVYRAAIDSYYAGNFKVDEELSKEMKLAFNREFTKGYFGGSTEVVSPERQMGRGLYLGKTLEGGDIKLEEDVQSGDGLGIWLKDKVDGAVISKIGRGEKLVEKAKKGETVKLFVRAPIGTKIYLTSTKKESQKIDFEKKKVIVIKRKKVEMILPEIKVKQANKQELLVKVYDRKGWKEARRKGADKVFFNILAENFTGTGAYVPRILNSEEVEKVVKLIEEKKVTDVLIGDLGVYALLKEKGLNLYLDYVNNVFNDYDLMFFEQAVPVVSPELSVKELENFKNKNFGVLVQGRVVLMNTKYGQLPAKLKDEKGFVFPVRKEGNYYQILNSKELGWYEEVVSLQKKGIKIFFLDLDKQVAKQVMLYRKLIDGEEVKIKKKGYTQGHLKTKVA